MIDSSRGRMSPNRGRLRGRGVDLGTKPADDGVNGRAADAALLPPHTKIPDMRD